MSEFCLVCTDSRAVGQLMLLAVDIPAAGGCWLQPALAALPSTCPAIHQARLLVRQQAPRNCTCTSSQTCQPHLRRPVQQAQLLQLAAQQQVGDGWPLLAGKERPLPQPHRVDGLQEIMLEILSELERKVTRRGQGRQRRQGGNGGRLL